MIRKKTAAPTTRDLSVNEAVALTHRIRLAVDKVWALLLEAHDRKAWKALKYPTWEAYIKAEFQIGRAHAYRLLDQGRVISAIEEATGNLSPVGDISERDARDVKDQLPAVTQEIKARVEHGEEPQKAATDVIAETRAAKDKAKAEKQSRQAEFDRQRDEARAKLPDAVKQAEAAKEAAIAAKTTPASPGLSDAERIAELEETVRILEGDIEKLKAENAKFSDMWVLYQKGGFEAVIAAKDEQIRVLNTRVSTESADKASWAKSAGYWKEQAQKLGFSNDVVIPLNDSPSDFGGIA